MSDFQAIADTGKTIISLLRQNMGLDNPNSIVLCSPAEANKDIRLSLYLYNIAENAYLKNQEMYEISPTQLQYPPLTLDLYYLLTAYSANSMDLKERAPEEHRLLGKAMRIFHDHAVMHGPVLQGNLTGSDLELRVTLHPLSLDELTKIWGTFPNLAYKTSVCYVVTPVAIDSTRIIDTSRVGELDLRLSEIRVARTAQDYLDSPDEHIKNQINKGG